MNGNNQSCLADWATTGLHILFLKSSMANVSSKGSFTKGALSDAECDRQLGFFRDRLFSYFLQLNCLTLIV